MSRVLRSKILKDIKRILNEDGPGGAYEAGGGTTEASGEAVNIDQKLEAFKKYLLAERRDAWNDTIWRYFAEEYSAAQKNWPKDKQFKPYLAAPTEETIDKWAETLKGHAGSFPDWDKIWPGFFGILVNYGYDAVYRTRVKFDEISGKKVINYVNASDKDGNKVRHLVTIADKDKDPYNKIFLMDNLWQSYIKGRLPQIDRKYGISQEITKICQEQPGKCVGSMSDPMQPNEIPQDQEDRKGKIFFIKNEQGLVERHDYDETGKLIQKLDQSGKPILDAAQKAAAVNAKSLGLPQPGEPGSSPQFPMSIEQFNNYKNPNVTSESLINKYKKKLIREETGAREQIPADSAAPKPTVAAGSAEARNPKQGILWVKDTDGTIKQVTYNNYVRTGVFDQNNRPSELAGDKAAAEASGTVGRKGLTICTGEPDLIPNLQRWLIYAKGQKGLNLDGIFGPQTWNALYKADPQGAGAQITDKTKICPFLRSKKATYVNEYNAVATKSPVKELVAKIDAAYKAAVAKNTAGGAAAPGQTSATVKPAGQAKLFESYEQFYDNKKIKNAELLFEKLIKIPTNKGKI